MWVEREFLRILAGAQTNSAPVRRGDALFQEIVHASRVEPVQVGAEAALALRFGLTRGEVPEPPAYAVAVTSGRDRSEGTVDVVHRRTDAVSGYHYAVLTDPTPVLAVRLERFTLPPPWVRDQGLSKDNTITVPVEALGEEAAQLLTDRFLRRLERKTVLRMRRYLDRRDPVVRFLENRRIHPPRALARVLELVWQEELLSEILSPPGAPADVRTWKARLERFQALRLARNDRQLSQALAIRLLRETQALCRDPNEAMARELLEILRAGALLDPLPDLWDAQNVFHSCAAKGHFRRAAEDSGIRLETLRELVARLGLAPEPLGL
jgi:hypothetical protein